MPKKRPQLQDFLDSEPGNEQELLAIEEIILSTSQVRSYFDPDKLLEFRLISQVVFFLKIQSIQPTTSSVIFDLV